MVNKIIKTINSGRAIKPTITPRARERSSSVIATSTLNYDKKTPRRLKARSYGNSFILGHTTLGRLRTDKNFEADCSDNGNHGTWNGTGIDGAQYISPAYVDTVLKLNLEENPTLNVVDDLSLEANDGEYKINTTALYDFTDGTGTTLTDNSVNSNDGTITGATWTTDRFGNENSALNFPTGAEDVSTPINSNSASFTISFWAKKGDSTSREAVTRQDNFVARLTTTQFQFYVQNSVTYLSATKSVTSPSEWNHYVGVCSGSTIVAYVNGIAGSPTNITGVNTASGATLKIGDNLFAPGFVGDIDSVEVLNGVALSDAEVTNLYNYTSVHKMTDPLVTKTDSDGSSITGLELAGFQYIENSSFGSDMASSNSTYIEFYPTLFSNAYNCLCSIGGGDRIQIRDNGNVYVDDWGGSSGDLISTGTEVSLNTVHKLLLTYDDTSTTDNLNLYLDGTLIKTSSASQTASFSGDLLLGSFNTSLTNSWDGVISKPIIFNRVLTSTERDALFAGTDSALLQPVQRLSAGKFNGTDNTITSTGVSEAGCRAVSFFIRDYSATQGLMQFNGNATISVDGSGNVTTSGFTNAAVTENAVDSGTHVYIEFDAETLTNPTIGYDGSTYFDGKMDELTVFDTTLTEADRQDIIDNKFYSNHSKYGNCVLWWSMDNPVLGNYKSNNVLIEETDN